MAIASGSKRAPTKKIVNDYKTLSKAIDGLRAVDYKIVLTIGSWDLLHIGHVRYLRLAKEYGDALVVGVDSDRGIRAYKGDLRPVVPEGERAEMLSYLDCVDFITTIDDIDREGRWQYELIKVVRPDIFIAVEDSYPEEQLAEIRKYCAEVIVLPRQAETTSTSNLIQGTIKKHLDEMYKLMQKR